LHNELAGLTEPNSVLHQPPQGKYRHVEDIQISAGWGGDGAGKFTYEWWTNMNGTTLADLTQSPAYPAAPTGSTFLTGTLEGPHSWVLVEVRDGVNPATVVARQAGLLQRDGDVVAPVDGLSPLRFTLTPGSYHVAVKHRNHLGVMTGAPVMLSATPTTVDFTTMSNSYGVYGQRQMGGVYVLWMGDTNGDGKVIAAGPGNDRNGFFAKVLNAPNNSGFNVNYVVIGYSPSDVNLDGRTIAAGPGNDLNLIFYNIFTHPANSNAAANYVVRGQAP